MLEAAFPGGDPDVDATGRQVYTDYRSFSENLNQGECMPTVKVLARGQLTIPAALRKELHLEEDATLSVVKAGDSLILTAKRLAGDRLAKKAEKEVKKAGLGLDDLLKDLEKQRERYVRERYGR